jgi:Fic family protein
MDLMNEISQIDRFDATWAQIEKREGQTLKQLKSIATVRSVGASTRIEGSKMTDAEVEVLIEKLKISKLEERDEQEVAGYFDALDTIAESYKDIEITEGNIKNLHKILMSHSEKDAWHRGGYKQTSNAVEANHPDGSKQILFKTTEPGIPTEEAMKNLLAWFHSDTKTLPIIKSALFVYDFLSIHPFQDGNGRLSRLLGTLLLLRYGYSWIQYVSFEHEIESRKGEYYKVLMQTQRQRPGEHVDDWIVFFLDCLLNIQEQLNNKLKASANSTTQIAPREKNILEYIANHPGSKSSVIAEKLNIPLPTVKRILTIMVENKLILKYGIGAGTNYIVEEASPLKTDLMFQLTNDNRKKEFLLMSQNSYIEIKKVVLTPLFTWDNPNEWSAMLIKQGLYFKISGFNNKGGSFSSIHSLLAFIDLYSFNPKITFNYPIVIPNTEVDKTLKQSDYPLKLEIEIYGAVSKIDFDIIFVYDER